MALTDRFCLILCTLKTFLKRKVSNKYLKLGSFTKFDLWQRDSRQFTSTGGLYNESLVPQRKTAFNLEWHYNIRCRAV